jgi:hypothetical protein
MQSVDLIKKISTNYMLILHVVFKYMSEVYHNCMCLLHVCVYCHFRMNLCMRRMSISVKFDIIYIYIYISNFEHIRYFW